MEHPLLQTYGPMDGWMILLVMGGASIGFFIYQVSKATRLVLIGSSDSRFDSWGPRIVEFVIGWLGQKKVLRDRVVGTMHVLMFWGFLMLASDMLDLATANAFSGKILPDILVGPWNGMVELVYTMALIGCVAALLRRVAFTPDKLKGKSQLEGNVILLLIFTITTTSFIIESKEDPSRGWELIGYQVGQHGLEDSTVVIAYWLHMLAISVFLFLIPLSKHMHLVMAVPNVFFHDTGPSAKMRPLATDDDGKAIPLEELDIDKYTHNTHGNNRRGGHARHVLDVRMFARHTLLKSRIQCSNHDVRNYANDHALATEGRDSEETMMERITDEAVWACTTCNACGCLPTLH